jgi:hypothetical protein
MMYEVWLELVFVWKIRFPCYLSLQNINEYKKLETINGQCAQYGPKLDSNTFSPHNEQKMKPNTFQSAGQRKHLSNLRKLV